jgi:PhoPQ-activated pathogenicity-related protein
MLATSRGDELLRLIDPFQKIHRIKIPKLVVLGTNDAYWPVDAASLYFEQLVGKKYLLYIPNARHEITDRQLINENLKVLTRAVAGEVSLPAVSFTHELLPKDGPTLWRLQGDQRPLACSLWYAQSKTRDFREALWNQEKPLDPHKELKTPAPKDPTLFTASFLKAVFDVGGDHFTVTSLVKITPPTMPTSTKD